MSKGNLFLGYGRGKIGDIVLSHSNGQQVARARNRSPKNPQTNLQLYQRAIMKTASSAYAWLRSLADHSFQGFAVGTANQSRFIKLNVAALRNATTDVFASGYYSVLAAALHSNYSAKDSVGCQINPYIISEGSIMPRGAYFVGSSSALPFKVWGSDLDAQTATYYDVVSRLQLRQGDQLTFILLSADDTNEGASPIFNSMEYCRVILEPSDGDMSRPFLYSEGGKFYINYPNPRNLTNGFYFNIVPQTGTDFPGGIQFSTDAIVPEGGFPNTALACAVIASRLEGDTWLRSTEKLVVRGHGGGSQDTTANAHDQNTLALAIESFKTGVNSSLYLNQSNG